jgi:F-type H+-transporting ATPase subunit b
MSFSWSTFALQAINFLLLVWLLKRFLFTPVSAIVAQRKAEIVRLQTEAEAARQAAEQSRKDFEQRRAEIDAQRERIIDQARAELNEERSRIIETARADIEKLRSTASKQLDEERERAAGEITERTVQIAVQLASRLLQEFTAPRLDELLLDRVLDYLDRLGISERAALLDQSPPGNGSVIVITACPLEAEVESKWRAALKQRFGQSQGITFAIDQGLIAGTELKFPHANLCFSWRHALGQAQQELKQHEHAE